MIEKRTLTSAVVGLALAAAIASPVWAGRDGDRGFPLSFSLAGGCGGSAGRGGLVDLKAEALVSIAPSLRLGLGVGYLSQLRGGHAWDGYGPGMMGGGMYDGWMWDGAGGFDGGERHSLRSLPLTLTAYWFKPLGRSFDVFLSAGAGYYAARYKDVTVQKKSAFGAQLGLGGEWAPARGVFVFAEAGYRFVELKGFRYEAHPGFALDEQGRRMMGSWMFDPADGRYHFREGNPPLDPVLRDLPPFDIDLSGPSLRAGLRLAL